MTTDFINSARLSLDFTTGQYALGSSDQFDPSLPLFFAAEIGIYTPPVSAGTGGPGYLNAPHLVYPHLYDGGATSAAASGAIKASDLGYRSLAGDPNGIEVYPPLLTQAFQIDRQIALDPRTANVGATWGTLSLSNARSDFDSLSITANCDGRDVTIYMGQKRFDRRRMYWADPSKGALAPLFKGIATPWHLDANQLNVPIRDASYWMAQPLQSSLYLGTGGLTGTAALADTLLPKLRGGTSSSPVKNITPILIDPTNLIYQYTDGPGTVVTLYDGADGTNFVYDGDVSDLYSGTLAAGHYRSNNARGLFQIGSKTDRAITIDATGAFPIAGAKTTAADLAFYLITEDMKLPAGYLDVASFSAAATAYPYACGYWFDPQANVDGIGALNVMLASIGATIIPLRTGLLGLLVLRALDASSAAVATLDTAVIVSLTPDGLPSSLDPPPFRFRVGYQHNFTVQTSSLSPAATADQLQFVAQADRYGSAASNTIINSYRRPNDPDPVLGALLSSADAGTVAAALVALWSTQRRLYQVELSAPVAVQREIGDVVKITYPIADLASGRLGIVVGESFSSGQNTSTLAVLV